MKKTKNNDELKNITISSDLIKGALNQLEFLSEINSNKSSLLDADILDQAIYRYETLWLPFYSNKSKNNNLMPPLDIEFVWHCHMLNPAEYYSDCMKLFGKLINHNNLNNKLKRDQLRKLTLIEWNKTFTNISFDYLDSTNSIDKNEYTYFKTQIKYDLKAACSRQIQFYYQVSLPHYKNKKFLKLALESYKKFIYLSKLNPNAFIVPTYSIDLIWHTHQLEPESYVNDTIKLLGHIFAHDDSVNDRSTGSRLNTSFDLTCDLWKKEYNQEYFSSGGMFRGNINEKIFCESIDLSLPIDNNICEIKFNDFNNNILTIDLSNMFQVKINFIESIQSWSNISLLNKNDELISYSRLINLNELPSSDLISNIETNLDIKYERAMLLTDKNGDYAIVKGRFKSNNKFIIKYISLLDSCVQIKLEIKTNQQYLNFKMDDLNVEIDLKTGSIKTDSNFNLNTYSKILTFLFSLICLYLPIISYNESTTSDYLIFNIFENNQPNKIKQFDLVDKHRFTSPSCRCF